MSPMPIDPVRTIFHVRSMNLTAQVLCSPNMTDGLELSLQQLQIVHSSTRFLFFNTIIEFWLLSYNDFNLWFLLSNMIGPFTYIKTDKHQHLGSCITLAIANKNANYTTLLNENSYWPNIILISY